MVTEAEVLEITQARAALEALTARQAAIRATDEDVARMREILSMVNERLLSGDLPAYSDGNASLHAAIIEVSQHRIAAGR